MMARTRNLKPGFFRNEDLAELGPYAMLLYAGLWTIADREGRLEDRPKRIKADVFPYFDQPVDKLLHSLAAAGFIQRYNGFICIPTWDKHQRPHVKEVPSEIPPPGGKKNEPSDLHPPRQGTAPTQDAPGTPLTLNPSSLTLNPLASSAADAAGMSSSSKIVRSPDTENTSVLVTPTNDAFERYLVLFLKGGKLLNDDDIAAARKVWDRLPLPEQMVALDNAAEVIKTTEPRYLPSLFNHLTRRGPGRMPPPPKKKSKTATLIDEMNEWAKEEDEREARNATRH